jgi:catechol 2,3-dioxygenase-like lactoylglutathione lyase family enzyme
VGLHQLDLNVADLKRSAAFYKGVLGKLGYVEGDSGSGWVSFERGDFYITIVQTQARFLGQNFHRKAVGVNHLAFPAATPAAVDAFFTWLSERGIPVLYGDPLDMGDDDSPNYAVYFEDPDRLKLEFVYLPRE